MDERGWIEVVSAIFPPAAKHDFWLFFISLFNSAHPTNLNCSRFLNRAFGPLKVDTKHYTNKKYILRISTKCDNYLSTNKAFAIYKVRMEPFCCSPSIHHQTMYICCKPSNHINIDTVHVSTLLILCLICQVIIFEFC